MKSAWSSTTSPGRPAIASPCPSSVTTGSYTADRHCRHAATARKSNEAIEKFSIVKALQAIERAQVVIAVLDASEGVTEQDVSLLGLVLERGRALVVVHQQMGRLWTTPDRKHLRDELDRRLPFLDFAERMTISALHGTAVGDLLPAVERAYRAAMRDLSTTELTRELESAD